MRWRGERQSDNIEDHRGMQLSRGARIGWLSGIGPINAALIQPRPGHYSLLVVPERSRNTNTCDHNLPPQGG